MKKRIFALCLALALWLSLAVAVSADSGFVYDDADLLTSAEEAALTQQLSQISQTYNAQVVVVTRDSADGMEMADFANRLYDSMGFGYGEHKDGAMLVLCMDIREYYIITNGLGSDAMDESTIGYIGEWITPDLSDGNYAAAFQRFGEECAYYLDGYINGFPFDAGMTLLFSAVFGLIVGLIVAFVLKGQLKSVRQQDHARNYMKPDSMHLTVQRDLYLYRNVTRTKIQKNTTSSSSSSGPSRSGGGGKF